jgi:peroxiredoxin
MRAYCLSHLPLCLVSHHLATPLSPVCHQTCCLPQSKGVDAIACISVNDAFVMDAWGKSVGAGDKVLMLADGNGQFAKALGVELDLADKGLGLRSRRYALLADDQVGLKG